MNKLQLKVGEKEFTAKIGIVFLENVTKAENLTLTEVLTKFESETLFFVPKLIYYAIENGGGKCTLEQITDWLDKVGIVNDEVMKFSKAFGDSVRIHVPKDMLAEIEGKPKATKKK